MGAGSVFAVASGWVVGLSLGAGSVFAVASGWVVGLGFGSALSSAGAGETTTTSPLSGIGAVASDVLSATAAGVFSTGLAGAFSAGGLAETVRAVQHTVVTVTISRNRRIVPSP